MPQRLASSATSTEQGPSEVAAKEETETVMDAFERRAKTLMSSLGWAQNGMEKI